MSTVDTPTVVQAWSAVMASVQAVRKTGYNEQQKYPFRGIDAVINAAGPAMREHGVFVMPTVLEAHYRDVEVGAKRTMMRETTVKVRYTVFGPDGGILKNPDIPDFGTVYGESLDSGDKGTAKATSVAYRIFLLQALSIPTDEPDADASSYERASRHDDHQPQPEEVTVIQVTEAAGRAFKTAGDQAPMGQKTLVRDRLRHAVIWAATKGRTASLKDCTQADLAAVHGRLKMIENGTVTFAHDDFRVQFTAPGGIKTVEWQEFEDTTKKGAGSDGPVGDGDAGRTPDGEGGPAALTSDTAVPGDGGHGHDVARPVPEPAPATKGEGGEAANGSSPEPAESAIKKLNHDAEALADSAAQKAAAEVDS